MDAQASLKNVTIEATIVRADGTREAMGVIAEIVPEKQSPVKALFQKLLGGK